MNNVFKWVLISLLSIIVIAITVLLVLGLTGKLSFINLRTGYKVSDNKILEKTIDVENKDLQIETDASEINIINSDENKVIIYGKKEELKFTENEDEIVIEYKLKHNKVKFNTTIAKIEIYLNPEYEGNINIENNYGDIKVGNYKNAKFNIDEDAGKVSIKEANIAIIDNDYGDIEINKAINVNIKESAGSVYVGDVRDAEIKNNFGEIKVDRITNMFDIKNDCGDVKLGTININENSYIKCDLGDIKVKHTNDIRIEAETDLGSVKVNNNNKLAPVKLDIKNDCGDIKVN